MTGFLLTAKQKLMLCINKRLYRCEQACTRGSVDRAVAIDEIKKFIAEQELHADKRYVPKMLNQRNIPFTEKIAVIGPVRPAWHAPTIWLKRATP